jgi:hypothetical protein
MPAEKPAAAPKRVPPASDRPTSLANAEANMPEPTAGGISEDPAPVPAAGAYPNLPQTDAPPLAPTDGDELEPARRPDFKRQPFGSLAQKLSAPKRDSYHRHWFNDVLDRIEQATAAGYTHVKDQNTRRPMSRVVGVAKGGGPLTAYLMEIPEKWFKEDARRKQQAVDEIDAALRGGDVARKDNDERYVPKHGIKIHAEAGVINRPEEEE